MQPTAIAELDRRFGIPQIARVVAGNGGLAKVAVSGPAAKGEIYLHGAHVTSWQPRGAEEVLFVSSRARWEDGHAIRGGIPICFPWFGPKADDPHAPMHGFVRTTAWQLESIEQARDAVTVTLSFESSAATKRWWPADFRLTHRATFGPELTLELLLINTGTTSLRFEEALHTYFRVGDIEKTRLQGLDGVEYLDKVDTLRKKVQHGPIAIVSETDRIYLDTTSTLELNDEAHHRRIEIAKQNSRTTVVWNPWVAKAKSFSDFGESEWRNMVCVETCNVSNFAVELAPGQQHEMRSVARVTAP
jgi:glucose-6-phosphate 1-epimerase